MSRSDQSAFHPVPDGTTALRARLDDLRALIPELPALGGSENDAGALCLGLLDLLERKQRHLIQDNVRLVALRELTENLLRDPEEERVLRTVSLYLQQAHGLTEVMVLARAEAGGLRGYRARSGVSGICEAVRWSGETVRGTAWETALGGESVYHASEEERPAGTPIPLPVILPIRCTDAERGTEGSPAQDQQGSRTTGLLAIRPNDRTGAGSDPLEVEQLAFQVATLLESVRHQQRKIRDRRFRECLMEAMEDGLVAVDGAGTITAANRAALGLLGVETTSLVGRPLATLNDRSSMLVEVCKRCLEERAPRRHQEIWIGAPRRGIPVNLSVIPLDDDLEDAGGIVATFSDLRPLRAMEEELRRLDRLAALGRFATAVAHEIRNPLAAIGAGVDFLASDLSNEKQSDLKLLRSEIARLDRIVADLLEPARTQPLELRTVTAQKLVQRACQTVEPLARDRNVRFDVRPPAEETFRSTTLDVDPNRMLQVLVNLIRNAVEASPPGQAIEIGWERSRGGGEPLKRVWVRDHGPGIPEKELEHLFEPFFSTKAGGTGLGLYVSNGVVEQHGGRLRVEAAPGGGTRASIDLPGGPR
ncbi:MAG: PAS domain S-box protein [Candidatus Eisenbacteria bacterium]|nr:PAS domain S-box protein [Candidatus Latescibacterota bacterium]MBD3301632.1 PAS domain S-box protein [Candidatus Eisenbacteria bacterium]